MAVVLPPKVYHYEPKIFGFKLAGKRGSAYFNPPVGNVRYVEDSLQRLELERVQGEKAKPKTMDVTNAMSKLCVKEETSLKKNEKQVPED